jgi:hypothetical protein
MLPTPKQSGQLYSFCMWHCNTQGLPFCNIATTERELLPHIFTLIPQTQDSYFLWHFLFAFYREPRLTQGGPPYAVRTFLTECIGTIAQVCSTVNLRKDFLLLPVVLRGIVSWSLPALDTGSQHLYCITLSNSSLMM